MYLLHVSDSFFESEVSEKKVGMARLLAGDLRKQKEWE